MDDDEWMMNEWWMNDDSDDRGDRYDRGDDENNVV